MYTFRDVTSSQGTANEVNGHLAPHGVPVQNTPTRGSAGIVFSNQRSVLKITSAVSKLKVVNN